MVARWQLLELGFSERAIDHRVARRRLRPVYRGVYVVGRPELTQEGRWMAAVLSCGRSAALSHHTGAALWQILSPSTRLDVTAPIDRRRPGIIVHRRVLASHETTTQRRIPVTTVVRTLIDIAPALTRDELERAVNEADKLGLIDPETLRDALECMPRRPGTPKLRDTLDRHTYVMTDTELERRFVPIARRAGLPLPTTQVYVNGYLVDFYWPDLGLVVETDGLRYHRTPAQQAKDRRRDQAHMAAGLVPLRFTRAQVRFEPDHVEEVVRAVARRLLATPGAHPRHPFRPDPR